MVNIQGHLEKQLHCECLSLDDSKSSHECLTLPRLYLSMQEFIIIQFKILLLEQEWTSDCQFLQALKMIMAENKTDLDNCNFPNILTYLNI
jgi:hypothetical protein